MVEYWPIMDITVCGNLELYPREGSWGTANTYKKGNGCVNNRILTQEVSDNK